MAELLVWLLSLVGAPAQPCEAISGFDESGDSVGVVVFGCAPEGVEAPFVSSLFSASSEELTAGVLPATR